MNNDEIIRVQTYLRLKFQNDMLTLKRGAKDDMIEVFMEDEFIGTLFRDDEEGEISYAFNMAILEFDLPTLEVTAPASILSPCSGAEAADQILYLRVNAFPTVQMRAFECIAHLRAITQIKPTFASRIVMRRAVANE